MQKSPLSPLYDSVDLWSFYYNMTEEKELQARQLVNRHGLGDIVIDLWY